VTTTTETPAAPQTATRRWRRARVIWNATAGAKAGIPTNPVGEERLREVLGRHGLADALVASSSEADSRRLAHEAVRDGYDLVVAAGGDGTIALVADELLGSETVLGILPLGSIMNIPRMLGLPRDVDAAAAVLADGIVRAADVGRARDRTFYEAGSVGMHAAMFRYAQAFDRGDYGAILRTIWVAIRYRPARMSIELEKETVRTRALMVTVSNGPYTGVGMTVAPDARLDDGAFDVRVFRGFSKPELLRHLVSIAFGRRKYSPHVSTYRSARVRIESASPLPCRADSHDLGTTPIEFSLDARALRVVVPVDWTGGPVTDERASRRAGG
jgi:diacylglycerol kinase (ATP)